MKKNVLILTAAICFLAQAALAQITFTATPTSQMVDLTSTNVFTVEIRLSIVQDMDPSELAGFDIVFEALRMQNSIDINNLFSVASSMTPLAGFTQTGFDDDPLTDDMGNSDRADYVQTGNQGYTNGDPADSIDTPFMDLLIATYTFEIAAGTANGTYNFTTTQLTTSPNKFSDVFGDDAAVVPVDNTADFSITIIPEPSTWSLIALGALGAFGISRLRAKRRS